MNIPCNLETSDTLRLALRIAAVVMFDYLHAAAGAAASVVPSTSASLVWRYRLSVLGIVRLHKGTLSEAPHLSCLEVQQHAVELVSRQGVLGADKG